MAAGAYLGAGSEGGVRETGDDRRRFLGETVSSQIPESPTASALVVGIGYFAGAVVPILPVLFGAAGLLPTVVTAGAGAGGASRAAALPLRRGWPPRAAWNAVQA